MLQEFECLLNSLQLSLLLNLHSPLCSYAKLFEHLLRIPLKNKKTAVDYKENEQVSL